MNEILQTLGNAIRDSGWLAPLVLLVIIMPLLVRIAREVLKARIELADIQRRKEESLAAISAKRPSATRTQRGSKTSLSSGAADAGAVVNTNFDILEKYYEQTLVENRLLSRSAIGVALFGFFVIIAGVSLALSGYTSVGVVSSGAGLLSEASTLLFFKQLREQVKQVQDYHKKLVSTQYLMTSIALTRNLDGDRHKDEVVRIISNLLYLSNELHGSKSDHLFAAQGAGTATPVPSATPIERLSATRNMPAA